MGLPYGENFIILTSTVFLWSTHLTDRRADGRAIAYTRYSMQSRVKTHLFQTFYHCRLLLFMDYDSDETYCSRRSRCSCTSRRIVCQQPAVARFLSQPPFFGTLCQMTCSPLKTFLFHQSFPDILLLIFCTMFSWTLQPLDCFNHAKNFDWYWLTLLLVGFHF